ncbi:hypothetical protein F938_01160 [Acinetobacter bereziniae LMG 1003 = CIP 70.12]|uniref:DUF2280 domain-containing protein n=1 Tax=Acinetobacter bereziniae LMG 1003 = CIP 70.12 TaxID=981324 RepID=N9DKF4_ACIBZ|nr:DUF2280 domain-containing protein [Acinetobacter bereziniae]ENV98306.1 hypothetical protein F938_01160 [Acinetobacter bereziniae LMG 1003 = CIP 70.12]MBJ9908545.1 DUF2280 domain-containing protein [Acinetobacter bereziniae]MBJ9929854.1 DUF2280 domain-containing protein [Acinetobacter bereziniae]MCU4314890.1 DUF2280 domain-containing protein [Acinetobacter bereziniae]MDP6003550.1 DUF2280 domain-containing protein [Acinetobacter bereziniae]
MAALKKEVKLYIVRSLAVFNTPSETVELVHQDFGIKVTKQQCEKYDPTKRSGENLSEELKKDFEKTREMFLGKPESIPIANLAVRLRRLENQYQKHSKNRVAALNILKQAAEDVGGKYTNKTELTGAGGGPLQSENTTYVTATPEMIKQVWDELESKY